MRKPRSIAHTKYFLSCFFLILPLVVGCRGLSGNSQLSKDAAAPKPTISMSVNPTAVNAGGAATLTWSTTDATSVAIAPNLGAFGPIGHVQVIPNATTTYSAVATGSGGSAEARVALTVEPAIPGLPSIEFFANPPVIIRGQSTLLTWSTTNATSVRIDPLGTFGPSGSLSIQPPATTTYTAFTVGTGGTASTTATVTVQRPPIEEAIRHIVFLVQENRSFDDYYGRLGRYRVSRGFPDDIDASDLNLALRNFWGESIRPYHFRTVCHEHLSPGWNNVHFYVDGGLMDNFMMEGTGVSDIDTHYNRPMGYYDETDLPYYYELATQFATSDRFFSPVLADTIPNRMYLFTGTSFGHIRSDPPPEGGWPQTTIFELLDRYGIEWRYYRQDGTLYLDEFSIFQNPADRARVRFLTEYFNILPAPDADQQLAPVIFIERAAELGLDEHPYENIQLGAANVKTMIDALMASDAWRSSVFILTYDEAGGFYDHVPPASFPAPDDIPPMLGDQDQPGDFTQAGIRVPLTVISPWVRPHFVSHRPREFSSILKLIETRFNLPPLTRRDAAADDMTEFFDFSVPSFLVPPPLPDQPTNGVCDFALETAPQ